MTHADLLTMADLLGDVGPERQAAWERLALARAVANALVTYRGQHQLSQRALAAQLDVRLSQVLDLRIALEVVPPGREPAYLAAVAGPEDGRAAAGGTRLLVAATP